LISSSPDAAVTGTEYGTVLRTRLILIGFGLTSVVVYGLLGLATGVTIDNDSGALLDSFRSIMDGDYRVSRTSGFPFYEFTGSLAYAVGGVRGVMALSLLLTLAALTILIQPSRALRSWSGLFAWLGLAVTPIVLTNASAVMETAMLLLMVALLSLVLSVERLSLPQRSALLALAMFALILTRSDSLFLGVATFIALVASWLTQRPTRAALWSAWSVAAGMAAGLVALWVITSRNPFSSDFLPAESLVRRILRGAVGTVTLFGPIGAVALGALVLALLVLVWKLRTGSESELSASPLSSAAFVAWWVLATLLLYGMRFLALPDELEYLLPLLAVLAITASRLMNSSRLSGVLALVVLWSSVATGLISVSLLGRANPWQASPGIQLSVQPGAWAQDLQSRQAAQVRAKADYQAFLKESLGELQQQVDQGLTTLIPRDSWNFVLNPGYARYYDQFESILGCDALTSDTLIPGWRVSQLAASFDDITAFEQGRVMNCEVVASIEGPVLVPLNSGSVAGAKSKYQRP
jgi:hypothetical protein